jgi:hypothetical protein
MAVEIKTDRLWLRASEVADASRSRAPCGELAAARRIALVPHPSEGDAERFIATRPGESARSCAIKHRSERALIDLSGIDGPAEPRDFGDRLGVPYRGYASKAAQADADPACARAGVDTQISGAFEENRGLLRIQEKLDEKLGFLAAGRRRVRSLSPRAERRPHPDAALPRAAWEARA